MKSVFKHPWIMAIVIATFLLFITVALVLYWYLVEYVYYNISDTMAIVMVIFPILVIIIRVKIDK